MRLQPAQLAALDAWIGRQDVQLSRPEAIRPGRRSHYRNSSPSRETQKLHRIAKFWRPYPADNPLRMSRQLVDAVLAPAVAGICQAMPGMAGRRSRRNGCFRGCCCRRSTRCQNKYNSRSGNRRRTVASCGRCRLLDTRSHDDHWTKCRHPETAHNTVSSYDCNVR